MVNAASVVVTGDKTGEALETIQKGASAGVGVNELFKSANQIAEEHRKAAEAVSKTATAANSAAPALSSTATSATCAANSLNTLSSKISSFQMPSLPLIPLAPIAQHQHGGIAIRAAQPPTERQVCSLLICLMCQSSRILPGALEHRIRQLGQ